MVIALVAVGLFLMVPLVVAVAVSLGDEPDEPPVRVGVSNVVVFRDRRKTVRPYDWATDNKGDVA